MIYATEVWKQDRLQAASSGAQQGAGPKPPGKGMVTVYASVDWSRTLIGEDDETVTTKLVTACEALVPGISSSVVFTDVSRWENSWMQSYPGYWTGMREFRVKQPRRPPDPARRRLLRDRQPEHRINGGRGRCAPDPAAQKQRSVDEICRQGRDRHRFHQGDRPAHRACVRRRRRPGRDHGPLSPTGRSDRAGDPRRRRSGRVLDGGPEEPRRLRRADRADRGAVRPARRARQQRRSRRRDGGWGRPDRDHRDGRL